MKLPSLVSQLSTRLKYQFLKLPFLNYDHIWSLLSLTPASARYNILNVEDAESFEQRGEEDANRLKQYIKPSSVVLDIGCGIGRVDKYLAPIVKQLHCADVSGRMLHQAKARLKAYDNVFFHKLNGRDLANLPSSRFDFIFSIAVFQHLEKEDTCRYLMECFRVLTAGGSAYLHFSNFLDDYNFAAFADYARNPWKRSRIRMRYHTIPELNKMLEKIGFHIESTRSNSSIVMVVSKP